MENRKKKTKKSFAREVLRVLRLAREKTGFGKIRVYRGTSKTVLGRVFERIFRTELIALLSKMKITELALKIKADTK